ncbi:RNA polymerase sigma factor SigW [Microaerobacter geothermalis]|uniref:RNA polymerase sigma factor SigW n=1 Tax=Microaerobacter geothermalis TaxID=674972 RepID=UPI001F46E605|nr:RNA polymerase sigma factor SigW [Microaerobacter geothermalis]MCF6093868.1 RNA polymerase sigma factor SigW [Microaerobacter geothermalis]
MEFVEKRLAQLAKKGDRQAFAELVDIYKDKVYHLAYRMLGNTQEAEDIGQETFLRVYSNLARYDEGYKFSTWIYRIATNLCIDRLRKRRQVYSLDAEVEGTDGLDMYSQISDQRKGPEEEILTSELQGVIQDAIHQLPPKYKNVIILRYVNDLSIQEISEILDIPVPTVKTRIHRGREALRKKLQHV